VFPAGAYEARGEINGIEESWWLTAPALLADIERLEFVSRARVAYQLGDAVLRLDCDYPSLLEGFPLLYEDCAVSAAEAPVPPAVRCTIRRTFEPPLIVLTFEAGAPRDPAAAAYNLLRPTQAIPPFRVWDAPLPGWRLAGGSTGPVLAACGAHVVLHPKLIPHQFLVEFLVGITLGAQPWTLPIHGASLRMGEAGVVLVGASRAGKTTTSLHLAARGHTLLGDEIALIRLATGEIVPFRRAVKVRPGPHGAELAAALGISVDTNSSPARDEEAVHRIAALFPDRPARPAPLRAVFFLGGFADRASIEPFQLTLDHADVFGWITTPEIAYCSWGVDPARRAFRLLALKEALSRLPCWLVKIGPPCETVELIEQTMEDVACRR
jgi:hypothetical protein